MKSTRLEKIYTYEFSDVRKEICKELGIDDNIFFRDYAPLWFRHLAPNARACDFSGAIVHNCNFKWVDKENKDLVRLAEIAERIISKLNPNPDDKNYFVKISYEVDDFYKSAEERRPEELTTLEFANFITFFNSIGVEAGDLFIDVRQESNYHSNNGGDEDVYKIIINCNDLFFWGHSDGEPIEREDYLPLQEFSTKMLENLKEDCDPIDLLLLWCSNKRKMRPQGACYKMFSKKVQDVFNKLAPEREINFFNPYDTKNNYNYKK